jgi:hypothetical protein
MKNPAISRALEWRDANDGLVFHSDRRLQDMCEDFRQRARSDRSDTARVYFRSIIFRERTFPPASSVQMYVPLPNFRASTTTD